MAGGIITPIAYHNLLLHWASHGYFIVAIKSCVGPLCIYQDTAAFAADQLHVINVLKADPTDPLWQQVDTARVAISGHSMGAIASVFNAANQGESAPFLAAIPLHPCPNIGQDLRNIARPIFFGTGSLDFTCVVPPVKSQFEAAPAPKVFVELAGEGHLAPQFTTLWDNYPIYFLNCHVSSSAADCELVYGDTGADSLCQGGLKTTECMADRGSVPPSPPPLPPPPSPGGGPICVPSKGCTVCGACCKAYLSDPTDCQKCAKEACPVSNVCAADTKSCNVCSKCCKDYLSAPKACAGCVAAECKSATQTRPTFFE